MNLYILSLFTVILIYLSLVSLLEIPMKIKSSIRINSGKNLESKILEQYKSYYSQNTKSVLVKKLVRYSKVYFDDIESCVVKAEENIRFRFMIFKFITESCYGQDKYDQIDLLILTDYTTELADREGLLCRYIIRGRQVLDSNPGKLIPSYEFKFCKIFLNECFDLTEIERMNNLNVNEEYKLFDLKPYTRFEKDNEQFDNYCEIWNQLTESDLKDNINCIKYFIFKEQYNNNINFLDEANLKFINLKPLIQETDCVIPDWDEQSNQIKYILKEIELPPKIKIQYQDRLKTIVKREYNNSKMIKYIDTEIEQPNRIIKIYDDGYTFIKDYNNKSKIIIKNKETLILKSDVTLYKYNKKTQNKTEIIEITPVIVKKEKLPKIKENIRFIEKIKYVNISTYPSWFSRPYNKLPKSTEKLIKLFSKKFCIDLQDKDCIDLLSENEKLLYLVFNNDGDYSFIDKIDVKFRTPKGDINMYCCDFKTNKYEKCMKTIYYPETDGRNNTELQYSRKGSNKLKDCWNGYCDGDKSFCNQFGCSKINNITCNYDKNSKETSIIIQGKEVSYKNISQVLVGYRQKRLKIHKREISWSCDDCEIKCEKGKILYSSKKHEIAYIRVFKSPYSIVVRPNSTNFEIKLLFSMTQTNDITELFLSKSNITKIIKIRTYCDRISTCEYELSMMNLSKWQVIHCYNVFQWLVIISTMFVSITILLPITGFCYSMLKIIISYCIAIFGLLKLIFKFWFNKSKKLGKRLTNKALKHKEIMHKELENEYLLEEGSQDINMKEIKDEILKEKIKNYKIKKEANKIKSNINDFNKNKQITNKSNASYMMNVMIFCLITASMSNLNGVNCNCAKIATMTVSSENCETDISGLDTCSITSSVLLTAAPLGQRSCYIIKNSKNHVIANIKIKTTGLRLKCKKNIKYYIPQPDLWCSVQTSCKLNNDWCEGDYHSCNNPVEVKEKLWKNNLFGKYWVRCDKPTFSGCLIPFVNMGQPGCFQYIVRIENEKKQAYEVFDCPEWSYELDVYIEENQGLESKDVEFTIAPGVMINKDNYAVTLTSASSPPSKLFHSCFIKKNDIVSFTECNKIGELTNGIIGDMQCKTIEDAQNNLENCNIDIESVELIKHDESIDCKAKYIDPEKAFDQIIPRKLLDMNLEKDENNIPFFTMINNALFTYQIDTQGYKIVHKNDKNKCLTEFISLEGCYSCVLGANLKLKVKTNFGSATGTLSCKDINLLYPISVLNEEKIINVTVITTKSHIDVECTVSCPDSHETININGILIYVPPDDKRSNDTHHGENENTKSGFDWNSIMFNPFATIMEFIIGIITCIIIVIILYLLFKTFIINKMISKKTN